MRWGRSGPTSICRVRPPEGTAGQGRAGQAGTGELGDAGAATEPWAPLRSAGLPSPAGSPPLSALTAANLLGSHGRMALALAAAGARCAVLDASPASAAYARQAAQAVGLSERLAYAVGDLAALRPARRAAGEAGAEGGAWRALGGGTFDLVVLEMGVLHYFLDLHAVMRGARASRGWLGGAGARRHG